MQQPTKGTSDLRNDYTMQKTATYRPRYTQMEAPVQWGGGGPLPLKWGSELSPSGSF